MVLVYMDIWINKVEKMCAKRVQKLQVFFDVATVIPYTDVTVQHHSCATHLSHTCNQP